MLIQSRSSCPRWMKPAPQLRIISTVKKRRLHYKYRNVSIGIYSEKLAGRHRVGLSIIMIHFQMRVALLDKMRQNEIYDLPKRLHLAWRQYAREASPRRRCPPSLPSSHIHHCELSRRYTINTPPARSTS